MSNAPLAAPQVQALAQSVVDEIQDRFAIVSRAGFTFKSMHLTRTESLLCYVRMFANGAGWARYMNAGVNRDDVCKGNALVIAHIELHEGRGQGFIDHLLQHLVASGLFTIIEFESVLSQKLRDSLKRKGFFERQPYPHEIAPSMMLIASAQAVAT